MKKRQKKKNKKHNRIMEIMMALHTDPIVAPAWMEFHPDLLEEFIKMGKEVRNA